MANEALPSMGYHVLTITNATAKTGTAREIILTAPQSGATVKWIDTGEFAHGSGQFGFTEGGGGAVTLRFYGSHAGSDATQWQIGGDQTLGASGTLAVNIANVPRFFGIGFVGNAATCRMRGTVTKPFKS